MKTIKLLVTMRVSDSYDDNQVALESVDNALKTAYDNGFEHPTDDESYVEYTGLEIIEG